MLRWLSTASFATLVACGGLVSPDAAPSSSEAAAPEVDAGVPGDATSTQDAPSSFPPPDAAADAACGYELLAQLRRCLDPFPNPPCDGGRLFTRLDDFLAFLRQLALVSSLVDPAHHVDCSPGGVDAGACEYDPRTPRLGPSDVHYSNALNEFVGPDGRPYIWIFIPDRNEWVLADANHSPATYALVLQYVTCMSAESD
jgi:hypothetical protein